MSNITGTIRPLAQIEAATTPTIYNVSVPLANTEVSQLLSVGVKSFVIRVRGVAKLQFAFISGDSSIKYITVYPGSSYSVDGLNFSGTLYFQTNKTAQIVEILEWK